MIYREFENSSAFVELNDVIAKGIVMSAVESLFGAIGCASWCIDLIQWNATTKIGILAIDKRCFVAFTYLRWENAVVLLIYNFKFHIFRESSGCAAVRSAMTLCGLFNQQRCAIRVLASSAFLIGLACDRSRITQQLQFPAHVEATII